jgi:hypothetical protein
MISFSITVVIGRINQKKPPQLTVPHLSPHQNYYQTPISYSNSTQNLLMKLEYRLRFKL